MSLHRRPLRRGFKGDVAGMELDATTRAQRSV